MAALKSLVIDILELQEALKTEATTEAKTEASDIVLLDIRPDEQYNANHITGAHRLDPSLLNRAEKPTVGLLPTEDSVLNWASELGLSLNSVIVVYDDGKATPAARALWVLHAYGFTNVHWLNGGFGAWVTGGHPVTDQVTAKPAPNAALALSFNSSIVLTKEALQDNLSQPAGALQKRKPLDARTAGEFAGTDVRSARGGHLPGAVHYEWLSLFTDAGTLKPESELRTTIQQLGLSEQDPCLVYCQSHQRSAVTYVVLKHLGFKDVAALDGAWSNWGNDPDTAIEL